MQRERERERERGRERDLGTLRSYVSRERAPNRAMGFLSNVWWSSHLK